MSNHFITKCSCGVVLSQCRCPDQNKTVTVIERGCPTCHNSKVNLERLSVKSGSEWIISDRGGNRVVLTQEDWKYINGIIHEHYHGED